jgi:hypothetical protein
MALVVEDGTGLDDANSYVSVAAFKQYWDMRGFDHSPYDTLQIEVALVRATDYHDVRWGEYLFGHRSTSEQTLQWPRRCVYDDRGYSIEGIPLKLKNAICEYARIELEDPGALGRAPITNETGLDVKASKVVIGPIEESFEFQEGAIANDFAQSFPLADRLISCFLAVTGGRSYPA